MTSSKDDSLAMHRCLRIDEIVRNIAFSKDVLYRSDFLNMALTCKAFHEPAMDALWEKMGPDLMPTLLLLPPHCFRQDESSPEMGVSLLSYT